MSNRVFEVLQQMLKLRKDRSVAQSKRVQAEYERVRNFNLQVESYAKEYETQWVKAAQQGDTVLNLQTQANFGLNLRATAKSQEPEVQALKSQSREALDKALQDAQRLKTLQSFLAKRKQQRQHQFEKLEDKALEDVLQARQQSKQ
jgi:flagellar biosynthesis chaperone FliJ